MFQLLEEPVYDKTCRLIESQLYVYWTDAGKLALATPGLLLVPWIEHGHFTLIVAHITATTVDCYRINSLFPTPSSGYSTPLTSFLQGLEGIGLQVGIAEVSLRVS